MKKRGVLPGFNDKELRKRRSLEVARLPRREIRVLAVLKMHKAFNYDSRMTTRQIAAAVAKMQERKAAPDQYLHVLLNLTKLRLVSTRQGRSGGRWLTDAGRARAKTL